MLYWDVIRREVCRVGFDQRNPKPETRNPKPTIKVGFELRNPKPETDSEDLTSPGPIETRNPKPETRNRLWRLTFPRTDRNPKPKTQNPKPETDSEDLTSPGLIETRNPKPTAKVGFNRRSPKPETRNRQRKWVSIDEARNPKPETDSESWFQATKPETRNPKPTAKVGFNRRNQKPETRNRLESDFWVALRIGTRYIWWIIYHHCTMKSHKNFDKNPWLVFPWISSYIPLGFRRNPKDVSWKWPHRLIGAKSGGFFCWINWSTSQQNCLVGRLSIYYYYYYYFYNIYIYIYIILKKKLIRMIYHSETGHFPTRSSAEFCRVSVAHQNLDFYDPNSACSVWNIRGKIPKLPGSEKEMGVSTTKKNRNH